MPDFILHDLQDLNAKGLFFFKKNLLYFFQVSTQG